MLHQRVEIVATGNTMSIWDARGWNKSKYWEWFVLLKGVNEENAKLCVENILIFYRMELRGNGGERELAFVQYMECSPPHYYVNEVLECEILRWSTDAHRDHTFAKRSCICGSPH